MSGRNLALLAVAMLAAGGLLMLWPGRAPEPLGAPQLTEEPPAPPTRPVEPSPDELPSPRAADRPEASPSTQRRAAPDRLDVAGRVLGADLQPIAGARVRLDARFEEQSLTAAETTSAADGTYAFQMPPLRGRVAWPDWRAAGKLWVSARAPGFWPARVETAPPGGADPGPLAIDLRLLRGACIFVKLVAAPDRPITQPNVQLVDDGPDGRQVVWDSVTAPDALSGGGTFTIPITTAGARTVEASAEGAGTGRFGPILVDPRADVRLPDLLLTGDGRIAGRVVHVSGPAFESLSLRVEADPSTLADTRPPGVVSGTVRSKLGGLFEFTGLRPGRYRVRPSGEPAADNDPWIPTGTSDASIVVAKTRLTVHAGWSSKTFEAGRTISCWNFVGVTAEQGERAFAAGRVLPEGLSPIASGPVRWNEAWTAMVPPGSLVFLRLRGRDERSDETWARIPTGGTDCWQTLHLPDVARDGYVVLRLQGGAAWLVATRAQLVSLRNDATLATFRASRSGDALVASPAPAGRHRIVVEPEPGPLNWILPGEQTVEVRSGAVTEALFTPVVGGRVQLTVVAKGQDGRQPEGALAVRSLVARAAEGAAPRPLGGCAAAAQGGQWTTSMSFTSGTPFLCARALAAGRHLIELEAVGFRPASAVVDVVAGEVTRQELVVHALR